MYQDGKGVEQDHEKAKEWLTMAGDAEARKSVEKRTQWRKGGEEGPTGLLRSFARKLIKS